jgi:LacI family transcriptional regulator
MGSKHQRRPVTMLDIAKRVGVSRTTVSFVLNNIATAGIPEETRNRILDVSRELKYRPNAVAKGLRTRRTDCIGFVTDEIATTPFAGDIIKGARNAAWANNTLLLIINTGDDGPVQEAAIEMLLERQVDSIIYAAMYHHVVHPPANIREVPTVLLNCYDADRSLPSVAPDEVMGGYIATETLIRRGHRRIGLVNLPAHLPAAIGRLQGYQQALRAYDLPFDSTLIRTSSGYADEGYHETLALMRIAAPPTAIFCATDRIAMGTYDALRTLQLHIPDDVAVLGFDNQELIAAYLRPALTTMALPHYEMGQWAVTYLLEHPEQEEMSSPVQHVLPCPLILRQSV